MTKFWKPFALLLIISLTLHAAKADDSISEDDLQNDQLIPEDAGDDLDVKESTINTVLEDSESETPLISPVSAHDEEEEYNTVIIPPEEGSGDVSVLSMRSSFRLEGENKATDEIKCSRQENADGGPVVKCQGGGLSAVPEDLDASTTVLDMSHNNLTQLSASTFPEKLDNLRVLVLSNNLIQTIDKNAFSGLPHLETVDLSGNALTGLDAETFSALTALEELDLGGNRLELPAGAPFLRVPALRKLRLAGCGLRQLPESTFDGMTSLEELDLGDNPIADGTRITSGVFAALTNLSALTLPAGTSPALLTEVCRSHGLLSAVSLGSQQALPCHRAMAPDGEVPEEVTTQKTVKGVIARAEFDAALAGAAANIPVDPSATNATVLESAGTGIKFAAPAALPPALEAAAVVPEKTSSENKTVSPEDSVPASSRSGVSGAGVNKTIIGLIIGGMLAAVALVVVKKNWSKIRGKSDEGARRTGAGAHPPRELEDMEAARAPEEVPLQNKSPPV